MASFDPSAAALSGSGVFGLPHSEAEESFVYPAIKDYERNEESSEAFIHLGMTRLMLRRLA